MRIRLDLTASKMMVQKIIWSLICNCKAGFTLHNFELAKHCYSPPPNAYIVKCETLSDSVGNDSRKLEGITGRRNVFEHVQKFLRNCVIPGKHNREKLIVWCERVDMKGPDISQMTRSSAIIRRFISNLI